MSERRITLNAMLWPLVACSLAAPLQAQEGTHPKFRGTTDCERCHTAPTARDRETGVLDRVALTEAAIWRSDDRHSKAYANLLSPLGRRIGELLQVDVLDSKSGCIDCHATSVDAELWEPSNVNFASEGVGCEACHGPSTKWVELHRDFATWHNRPAAEKSALGWNELGAPVRRAEVCASCHIGSEQDHRLVTHAMFAAGHPPLMGFEIESFANKMPRHWRYTYEKTNQQSFDRTRNLLVGSAVALRASVGLIMADVDQGRWPELARMDCFACHHDLAESQWRQLRAASGIPGRPELTVGCLPLVEIAARVVAGKSAAQQLDGLIERLQSPFRTAAFGSREEIAKSGPEIIRWCRYLEENLEKGSFDAQQATAVLHELSQLASQQQLDFDTARQLLGAWCVVYDELVANRSLNLPAASQQQIDALLKQIRASDFFVVNRLRSDSAQSNAEDQTVTARLPALFADRQQYKPDKFAQVMSRLDQLTRP